ncbi:MAG: MBL fold metallo-hydrolase [Muribaculaceae bacterium]|nr:MBL fold metallo-hydrolase [Muribaculaceae bacterium]
MRVQRIIHPVGQGAFYSERFFDDNEDVIANVIYDCGTMSLKSNLKHEIEDYFLNQEIDILFLSHLHADHINGVKTLKKVCKKIKNVILPFITTDDSKYLLFYLKNIDNASLDVIKLVESPEDYFDQDTRIIRVLSDWNEISNNTTYTPENLFVENLNLKEILKPGFPIKLKKLPSDWIFLPINLKYDKYIKQFKNLLSSLESIKDLSIYLDKDSVDLKKIKEIFKKSGIPLELNSNSLLLYSGPCTQGVKKDEPSKQHYLKGCLYTGDSCFVHNDIPMLLCILKGVKNHIGLIQIPHHGSKENFSTDIFKINSNCKYYFLSHGIENRYGHPSINILVSFSNKLNYNRWHLYNLRNRILFCVNEDPQSALIIDINI